MTAESLPQWNLEDLYAGPNSDVLNTDLKTLEERAKAFGETYRGKIASLDGKTFGQVIAEYEDFGEIAGKVMSYAQLLFAGNIATLKPDDFIRPFKRKSPISRPTRCFSSLKSIA